MNDTTPLKWRAYFTEGRRYNSGEHSPEELPTDGVLGIVKYLGRYTQSGVPYRQILSGDDHYFWWSGEWFCNRDSPEEIEQRYPGALVLRGKWTTDAEMKQVQDEMERAREEP